MAASFTNSVNYIKINICVIYKIDVLFNVLGCEVSMYPALQVQWAANICPPSSAMTQGLWQASFILIEGWTSHFKSFSNGRVPFTVWTYMACTFPA